MKCHLEALKLKDIRRAMESRYFADYKVWNPAVVVGEQLLIDSAFNKTRCKSQLRTTSSKSMYVCVGGQSMWINCELICPICNSREPETIGHFLLKCPVYGDIRRRYIMKYTNNIVG